MVSPLAFAAAARLEKATEPLAPEPELVEDPDVDEPELVEVDAWACCAS